MIVRAFAIFMIIAAPLYFGIKYVLESRLTREQAARIMKKVGIAFISAFLAGFALSVLMLADKLL